MRLLPRRRATRVLAGAAVAIVLALCADVAVVAGRIDTWPVTLPRADDGVDTWVIVGSDSRTHLPTDADPAHYGTPAQVGGERADLVVIVTVRGDRARAVSVPRDLLVSDDGYPVRLALTLQNGPQHLVDALCTTLGVPADHLVGLHFDGFVSIVDAVGGVDVRIPHPLRDELSGLDLPTAGPQTLDGAAALALVRSRSAERLIDGVWQPAGSGADDRASWGAVVLDALLKKIDEDRYDPAALQRIGWAASGALRTDGGTGLLDLAGLAVRRPSVTELPHGAPAAPAPPGAALPLPPDERTTAALVGLGLGSGCAPDR
ncbi:LCP family protein [Cumulibacter manganitolerans]|uniref:LCP family protein n=1 Tax=Cumulibacter manganitolerans TaxID=1884992 RepID=UPI00188622E5|nr:LCP family protein [Cumulibacter manganitolerans]